VKVDLLRQLDEWGDNLEASLDHLTADEVLEIIQAPVDERPLRAPGPWWRPVIRYGGVMAVIVALAFALPNLLGSETSREFNSVGGVDGGGQTFAATTAAPATSAAPDTTGAATTTAASALTLAPSSAIQVTPTTAAPTTTAAPSSGTTIPPAGGNPADLGRAVIFVGDIAIDTTDVSAAVAQARAIVESRGGYVFAQELGGAATVVSLKVPAEFFQDTVDRITELGTVRNARVTSQDVTERIVDLESQIVTAETSVTRLQQLIGEADTINAITKLEQELLERETTLEQLRGRLRTLQDQVALSTIVVTIREFVPRADIALFVTARPTDGGFGDDCFTEAKARVPEGSEFVFCVDMTNTGNLMLTDIEIDGSAELIDGLRPVTGEQIAELAPGERYTLWTIGIAAESLREEISVRAVPLSAEGERVVEATAGDRAQLRINVPEPQPEPEPEDDGLPSLGDALANGWKVLTTTANAVAVAFAFMLPFIWVPLVLAAAVWSWRRRPLD